MPSKFCAAAGEVGQRVEEFAVVRAAGAELIVDRLVAGRHQHLAGAEAELVELRQRHFVARLRRAGQARRRFGEQLGDAAGLLAGEQRAHLGEPRFRGVDQARQLGHRRGQLDRVGPQRRQRLVEADQRGVRGLQRRRQYADRGREVVGLVGERPGEDVEVVDQALQVRLVGAKAAKVRPVPATSLARSCFCVPVSAWVTWELYLPASPPNSKALFSACPPVRPLHLRQLGEVFGRGRFVGQRACRSSPAGGRGRRGPATAARSALRRSAPRSRCG